MTLALLQGGIRTMSVDDIEKVRALEARMLAQPQVEIKTLHLIHGGMYARTIMVPAGVALTGALIKIATVLIVSGDASMYANGDSIRLTGYYVIPASKGRKQVFVAHQDTMLTMLFPSDAMTVEAAEAQFTDEADMLFSRGNDHDEVVITGE